MEHFWLKAAFENCVKYIIILLWASCQRSICTWQHMCQLSCCIICSLYQPLSTHLMTFWNALFAVIKSTFPRASTRSKLISYPAICLAQAHSQVICSETKLEINASDIHTVKSTHSLCRLRERLQSFAEYIGNLHTHQPNAACDDHSEGRKHSSAHIVIFRALTLTLAQKRAHMLEQ